jgi:hypothetical protein
MFFQLIMDMLSRLSGGQGKAPDPGLAFRNFSFLNFFKNFC